MISSILGTQVPVSAGTAPRHALRSGRVVSPVPPTDPSFQAYVDRCLKTWSVDVELESGEYLVGCRVVSLQGNSREGVRRLPRLPQAGVAGEIVPGDVVLIGFMNGVADAPIVLGTLSPSVHPQASPDDVEAEQILTRDLNETQDRLEHVDRSVPDRPLFSHTMERNTGQRVEREQVGSVWIDGEVRQSHLLERSLAGRSIEREQRVEVTGATTAIVRDSNRDGTDLTRVHAVKDGETTSSVIIQDLEAKVLQLTQQVETLSALVLRSDNARTLLLQQETPETRVTAVADSASKTVSLLAEDRTTSSRSGLTLGAGGTLVLRRSGSSNEETTLTFNDDGTVVLQTKDGPTILLDEKDVMVTSGGATLTVSEETGVNLVAKSGTMISAFDDAIVVTGPTVTVNSQNIHLKTGGLVVGDSSVGAKSVPDSAKVERAIQQLQQRVAALTTAFNSHVHPTTSPGAPTGPSVTKATPPPAGLFLTARDSLRTVKGS